LDFRLRPRPCLPPQTGHEDELLSQESENRYRLIPGCGDLDGSTLPESAKSEDTRSRLMKEAANKPYRYATSSSENEPERLL
jgi:hypothetical protein